MGVRETVQGPPGLADLCPGAQVPFPVAHLESRAAERGGGCHGTALRCGLRTPASNPLAVASPRDVVRVGAYTLGRDSGTGRSI